MRTLQDDNQRLSASTAAPSEPERKHHQHPDSEIKQLKEKRHVFPNLLPEKQLLFSQSRQRDELLPLNENFTREVGEKELWRQAVTNLKERISNFEMDVCKLKQDNETRVETSRERETQNQALPETNTQLLKVQREEES